MTNIPHLNTDCQDPDEIPVITQVWDQRTDTPTATPLADLYAAGIVDAAGADAELMTYEEWVGIVGEWTFGPEPAYFEDEVR